MTNFFDIVLLFTAVTAIPTPTYCDSICNNPGTGLCNVHCGCIGCFSTTICDKFNKQTKFLRSLNSTSTDENINYLTTNIDNICEVYVQPDWSNYDSVFETSCQEYKLKNCKKYCKQCDAELMCSTIKIILETIMKNYDCTTDSLNNKLNHSFTILIVLFLFLF